MKEPTVTIVVPAYQRLGYLREALASALKQTYTDFELIVSDDSSSDEIAAHVDSLADPRVRYRRNKRNLGIAMNHFAAFSEARGVISPPSTTMISGSPDFWRRLRPPSKPTLKSRSHSAIIISSTNRAVSSPDLTETNSRRHRRSSLQPGRHQPFLVPAVLNLTLPMAMAAVFRKSILEGTDYPARIGGCYDYWLAYLALRNGQACYYVPRRLTRYRVHPGSATHSGSVRNFQDAIYVRRKFLLDPKLAACRSTLRNELGIIYGKLALHYLSQRSRRRGKVFLRTAFSLLNRPKNQAALFINSARALRRGIS